MAHCHGLRGRQNAAVQDLGFDVLCQTGFTNAGGATDSLSARSSPASDGIQDPGDVLLASDEQLFDRPRTVANLECFLVERGFLEVEEKPDVPDGHRQLGKDMIREKNRRMDKYNIIPIYGI
jgi:hypothetical protein